MKLRTNHVFDGQAAGPIRIFTPGGPVEITVITTAGSAIVDVVEYDAWKVALIAVGFEFDWIGLGLTAAMSILEIIADQPAETGPTGPTGPTPEGDPVTYTPGDFDRNHIGLTFGGLLPGNEIWVCSLKLAASSDGEQSSSVADLVLNDIDLKGWMESSVASAVRTYFQADSTGISNACWLTFAKLSRFGRNGKLRSDDPSETYEHVYPAGTIGGSNSGQQFPNQIALAVTLTTDYTRGPAHKGRFYLPMPTWGVSEGLISAGAATNVANATKTFLQAVSDMPGVDLPSSPGAVVMSRKAGAAVTREVKGVAVGRAYDTIRRRRGKVAENYINVTVDQGAF